MAKDPWRMTRSASQPVSVGSAALRTLFCSLLVAIGWIGESALAQPFRMRAESPSAPSLEAQQAFQTKIEEQARLLGSNRRFRHLGQHERQALVEFVAGNVLFATIHELGLMLLSELSLPTVGGRDQAADHFAILTALELGKSHFSNRILMEAAKAQFTGMRREKAAASTSSYEHGLNLRRAYRMVCLMTGADAVRFKALVEETALPKNLQRNCGWDYDRALRSWEILLRPHRPAPDQPQTQIGVSYRVAAGNLAIYAQVFRNLRFLETIAEVAASQVAWRAPLSMEMRSCRVAAPTWDASTRTLGVCYELAEKLAELYRSSEQERR